VSKNQEPKKCRKCGCELSIKELQTGGMVSFEGTPTLDIGQLCFICRNDSLEKAGFMRLGLKGVDY